MCKRVDSLDISNDRIQFLNPLNLAKLAIMLRKMAVGGTSTAVKRVCKCVNCVNEIASMS